METRAVGSLQASLVGLGCNNFGMMIDAEKTTAVVNAALECGVNYFDTADIYGSGKSEEFLGQALGSRRSQVVIGTKFGMKMGVPEGMAPGGAEWVREATNRALTRLGTDYIDHLSLHSPDPTTPIEETLGAMQEMVEAGKALVIGCSNFSATQLEKAEAASKKAGIARFATVQNHYSLLHRDPETDGVLEACARNNIAMVPFFPLESGLLSGKYTAGEPIPADTRLGKWGSRAAAFINDDRLAAVAKLSTFAAERGHTILELAMSWLAGNPQVATVISGATKPEQVRANTAAAEAWKMSAADRQTIDAILKG